MTTIPRDDLPFLDRFRTAFVAMDGLKAEGRTQATFHLGSDGSVGYDAAEPATPASEAARRALTDWLAYDPFFISDLRDNRQFRAEGGEITLWTDGRIDAPCGSPRGIPRATIFPALTMPLYRGWRSSGETKLAMLQISLADLPELAGQDIEEPLLRAIRADERCEPVNLSRLVALEFGAESRDTVYVHLCERLGLSVPDLATRIDYVPFEPDGVLKPWRLILGGRMTVKDRDSFASPVVASRAGDALAFHTGAFSRGIFDPTCGDPDGWCRITGIRTIRSEGGRRPSAWSFAATMRTRDRRPLPELPDAAAALSPCL
ncbi:hypothetical protein LAZ40_03240 [Cereibacter sphaeroides]|uniref:hypothetical protein n=1 Tax=Cereibacter sphaeroides TaxID=1063 RepID=UPI001F398B83|nr:hypothetical protein [Cereibacter sphaeroides]MCE6958070.1 hypothetical protein [Cereibacter sphaeroides]MCE6971319.1 hypothetical protein [Cereibacter sphaeroides]